MTDKELIVLIILLGMLFYALLAAAFRINDLERELARVKSKQPVIIYQVDNAGTEMHGKVTGKEIVDGKHTLDCGIYGKFLVTKEVYDSVEVGDPIPDYLKGRTND